MRVIKPIAVVLPCTILLLLVMLSPISYGSGDARATLLVSQSLLEHGTMTLDNYRVGADFGYMVVQIGGHWYEYFPLGTALCSVPFVWIARRLGLDMDPRHSDDYLKLQKLISALICVGSFLLVYFLFRLYLSLAFSFILALGLVLGGPLVSTLGVALWSMNFTVLFHLLSLWLLAKSESQEKKLPAGLLAFSLFMAFLCRPTAALFVGLVFIYVFIHERKSLPRLVITCLALLTVFLFFSQREFQRFIPPYYLPQRITGGRTFLGTALLGNLFSPARGLFVYCPYLLLTFALIFWQGKRLARYALFWLALAWVILHWLVISFFPHWWGGHCFGCRLMTDVFPALVLLTAFAWSGIRQSLASKKQQRLVFGFFLLLASAVILHTGQGLFNRYTQKWNAVPNIDIYPHYLWEWRYPLFFTGAAAYRERIDDFLQETRYPQDLPLPLGMTMAKRLTHLLFIHPLVAILRRQGVQWSEDARLLSLAEGEGVAVTVYSLYRRRALLQVRTRVQVPYSVSPPLLQIATGGGVGFTLLTRSFADSLPWYFPLRLKRGKNEFWLRIISGTAADGKILITSMALREGGLLRRGIPGRVPSKS